MTYEEIKKALGLELLEPLPRKLSFSFNFYEHDRKYYAELNSFLSVNGYFQVVSHHQADGSTNFVFKRDESAPAGDVYELLGDCLRVLEKVAEGAPAPGTSPEVWSLIDRLNAWLKISQ